MRKLLYALQRGLEIWMQHGAPARVLDDSVILASALLLGVLLATYDRELLGEFNVLTLP